MTRRTRARLVAPLLRWALVSAVLTLIAGLFGMHVMVGTHTLAEGHAMTTSGTATTQVSSPVLPGHRHTLPEPEAKVTGLSIDIPDALGSSCGSGDGCPSMSGMGTACVPAPATTALTAPASRTASWVAPVVACTQRISGDYLFDPESPSPGQLSISRT